MLTTRDHILREVADVTKRLTNQTLELEVRRSSLAYNVVSLDKELSSTLSYRPGV